MNSRLAPVLLALGAMCLTGMTEAPAFAKRDEQGQVRREMQAGNVRSLREIESRVVPKMRGSKYLGPEYDSAAMAYRLKFIRDGRVVWIDVDARSGRILKRSD